MPISYNVVADIGALREQTDPVRQKQLPFAIALALTRTARDHVMPGERAEMQKVFDRPTPYTLNSQRLDPATKSKLIASVELKGDYGAKSHYLWPQIEGGPRVQKRFEILLQNFGILHPGWRAVPGQGATIDAFGNMNAGQVVQILSQLRVQMFSGFESRIGGAAYDKKKVARAVKRQGYRIFAVVNKTGRLLPGIYARYDFAHGSAIKPLMIFVRNPVYKARFDFFGVGETIAKACFPAEFDKAMTEALATAR